jgi:hypothetical protein
MPFTQSSNILMISLRYEIIIITTTTTTTTTVEYAQQILQILCFFCTVNCDTIKQHKPKKCKLFKLTRYFNYQIFDVFCRALANSSTNLKIVHFVGLHYINPPELNKSCI